MNWPPQLSVSQTIGAAMRWCAGLLWVLLALFAPTTSLAAQATKAVTTSLVTPFEIKFWVGGMSPSLRDYQVELVEAALKLTDVDSPPYYISYNHRPMSAERSKIATERGQSIHAHFSSEWHGDFVNKKNVYLLDYPFLKDRLGLRKCITLSNKLPMLSGIDSLEKLKALRIGQQSDWTDIIAYSNQGMEVVAAEDLHSLLSMLERNRYDCMPMSVLEIDRTIADQIGNHPELVVAPDLYVFYPMSVYLSVSKSQPLLYQRLKLGLDQLFSDGTAAKLFDKHYGKFNNELNTRSPRVFVLPNPLLPSKKNNAIIDAFNNRNLPASKN